MIRTRKATPQDTKRILAISAQIWDGNDYVPSTLAGWLTDPNGELLVAEVDGAVVGFAYRTWLLPGHAWLQGIRTDPLARGKGVGKALSHALIDRSREEGATRISLSTYIDNTASLRLIDSLGFERVASFVYLERTSAAPPWPDPLDPGVAEVPADDAVCFVSESRYLATAHGWYPVEWLFLPFADRPQSFLQRSPYRTGFGGARGGDRFSARSQAARRETRRSCPSSTATAATSLRFSRAPRWTSAPAFGRLWFRSTARMSRPRSRPFEPSASRRGRTAKRTCSAISSSYPGP